MNFDDAALRLVELAASRHNAFHTNEAAAIGITADRLRRARTRGELIELRPKVWAISGGPCTPHQRLRAATLALTGSAAGNRSAAWLHRWVSAAPRLPQLWAGARSRGRLSQASVRRSAKVDPGQHVVDVDGISCLNMAATLCTLGASGDRRLVEQCLDSFLRTESAAWLDETISRLWTPYAKGPRMLASVMNDPSRVSGVTDSWMERVLAQLVATSWMPPVVLQQPVTVDDRTFRLDIAVPELMLGIEAHGRAFHWGPARRTRTTYGTLPSGGPVGS